MKSLLLAGGCALVLLGLLLMAGAAVVFFIVRRRKLRPSMVPPAQAHPRSSPVPPSVAPPVPPPASASAATVMVDMRQEKQWGALHAVSGVLAGAVLPVDREGFYIGRDATVSQVVVDDVRVSKRHVWIGVKDGGVVAIDQGSTNGTYLNSLATKITESELRPEDTLIVSDDVVRLVYRP